jgi:hypothetical protein
MSAKTIDNLPKTWAGLRKITHKGLTANRFNNWIRGRYKQQGTLMTFTLREIMEGHGMNYESWRDYQKAIGYFMKQRKFIENVLVVFWNSDQYKQCVEEDWSEDDIFETLISNAINYDIYPMWADPQDENKYKLFDLNTYLYLKRQRGAAVVSEIDQKSRELSLARRLLPKALLERYDKPKLKGDGAFIELPEHASVSGRVHCPFCKMIFVSDDKLIDHLHRKHHND